MGHSIEAPPKVMPTESLTVFVCVCVFERAGVCLRVPGKAS